MRISWPTTGFGDGACRLDIAMLTPEMQRFQTTIFDAFRARFFGRRRRRIDKIIVAGT